MIIVLFFEHLYLLIVMFETLYDYNIVLRLVLIFLRVIFSIYLFYLKKVLANIKKSLTNS